jgi:trimethylamine--corrinoid protein Co-methyltransferase
MRNGGHDANDRAQVTYQKTLEDYEQPALDDAVREELEDYVIRRRAELGD